MITSLKTNYSSVSKYFCFKPNKLLLIGLAKSGKPRPHYTSNLYIYLCSCTNKNNKLYDCNFDKLIRSLRPDWFERRVDITNKIKDTLILLAKNSKDRPKHGTKLYSCLIGYTCKNSRYYDGKFTNKIKSLRPDWLFTRSQKAINKKQQIIKIAKSRKDKPKRNTVLGVALKNYTNRSSPAYDKLFAKLLKKLRPDWF